MLVNNHGHLGMNGTTTDINTPLNIWTP